MDISNIDFRKNLPEIIEAYVTVFGEEYRSIITARLLDCTYVFYNTYEGMKSYLDYHNRDYPQYIFDEAQRREKIMGIKLNELYIELMNLFPLETLPYLDSAGSIDAARKSFFEDFPNNVSDEVALVISDLKVKKEAAALKKSQNSGPICANFFKQYSRIMDFNNIKVLRFVSEIWKNGKICVNGAKRTSGHNGCIMSFTQKPNIQGISDYTFLHECCHVIENNYEICGFRIHRSYDYVSPCVYDLYERLNETITDLFAIEAREVLYEKGIYFAEPLEMTRLDVCNINTGYVIKDIVRPFLEKYRQEIICARITGDMSVLFDEVGVENFEELNHIVNKVEWLISRGLYRALKNEESNDFIMMQYYGVLEEVKELYVRMEKHSSKTHSKIKKMT